MNEWAFFWVFLAPFFITWALVKLALNRIGSRKSLLLIVFAYAVLTILVPVGGGAFYLVQHGQSDAIVWMFLLVLLSRFMEFVVLRTDQFFSLVSGKGKSLTSEGIADDEQVHCYPNRLLLLLACLIVIVAWSILILLLGYFVLGFVAINLRPVMEPFFLPLVAALVLLGMVYAFIGWRLRCARCDNHVLVEGNLSKHPDAHRIKGLSYWATVIVDILFSHQFTCMYCGRRYLVAGRRPRVKPYI